MFCIQQDVFASHGKNLLPHHFFLVHHGTVLPSLTYRAFRVRKRLQMIWDYYYYFLWLCSPARAMASSSTRFLDHTRRRATVGRTPLDEWSETSTWQYTTHTTYKHPCPRWDSNPRLQQASGRRPRSYWYRRNVWDIPLNSIRLTNSSDSEGKTDNRAFLL
jgi:hypothetical protein